VSTFAVNATHDPALRSWVDTANLAGAEFPIQNLPFAVFKTDGGQARCGVGIGDQVLDVAACASLFGGDAAGSAQACAEPALNTLMALGPAAAHALRARLSQLLDAREHEHREATARHLLPIAGVELVLPVRVGGYTDFFASVHHATNAGWLFRPDNPLLPNYKYVPIAYNGRANSVRVSGDAVRRPHGQIRPADTAAPSYEPARRVDHEVELALYIGRPSQLHRPVRVADAWDHVFGFSLLNDWSARDIQAWEYQPLGPFLAKSFATTVSPWVVTAEALAPFRTAPAPRSEGDPEPLPYLADPHDASHGALHIALTAQLRTAAMAARGIPPLTLSTSNAASLYWTCAQMLAHHTSNGSALDTGDLLGSGTISGASEDALGSLLEITRGGARPFEIAATGETRRFLEDGDEVTLTGRSERAGCVPIGFGACSATLLPASA